MAKIGSIPWSNVNYKSDVIDALMWCRRVMRILGIWPLMFPDTSTIEKILATISFSVCWSALGFLLIPMTIYTLSDQTEISDKIKMLGPLGYVVASVMKYMLLVIRHRSIRRCIHVLGIDWRTVQEEDYRTIMIKDSMKGHTLSKFCMSFIYCGGLCYNTVIPFLSRRPENVVNITFGPVTYPGFDILFDLRFLPAYAFVFFAQLMTSIIMFNITTAVCCLAATFVAHACGQIGIVMARVECLVKGVQNNRKKSGIGIIVNHHVQALRFSASIEDVLNELCMVEIVESTLVICLLEYYCLAEWHNNDGFAIMTYIFLLTSFVFNIYMFCYIGELLTDQCSKVGYTSYEIEWYHLPGKTALDLTLMISMSHNPVKITAGKLISLSFTSFGNVMKTSVAYLNLLRTVV
ncbi:PREDICTED: uncharacterized protein LOC106744617 [Dinoponera quadriceps]|uniref:Odorant receptor n=1 Tax=Dinoponera quadriceps TaxID=609295 RepID=A0A6P3XAW4_DINQU|nr:PREDICTED: uncharacterized protein LOC106744617 [Dinoponera quadriceps]